MLITKTDELTAMMSLLHQKWITTPLFNMDEA